MKVVSGRDFARIVERRGWRLLRIAGTDIDLIARRLNVARQDYEARYGKTER